jgi:hypothetical protein
MSSAFINLPDHEIEKIRRLGEPARCAAGTTLFQEGDDADFLYFVETGGVSLYIEKFNTRMEIQQAVPGDWFGEIAVYTGSHRTASAVTTEDTRFLRIARDDFHAHLSAEPETELRIRDTVSARNLQLVLEEKLVSPDGRYNRDLHIGIKGDPSLRESALERPRYESVVDRHLTELVPCFEDLLVNRTVHRIQIGFNNGEIRLSTVLDPLSEEFHPAQRLLDASYVDRHFPTVDYAHKVDAIHGLYRSIGASGFFGTLPDHLRHGFGGYFTNWQPLTRERIAQVISRLPLLRAIPNFYVRNLSINIVKDAIHMQFNCDGTHIVSSRGFEQFLENNIY